MKQILILLEQRSVEHRHWDIAIYYRSLQILPNLQEEGILQVQEAHLHSLDRDIFLPTMKNTKEPALVKNHTGHQKVVLWSVTVSSAVRQVSFLPHYISTWKDPGLGNFC